MSINKKKGLSRRDKENLHLLEESLFINRQIYLSDIGALFFNNIFQRL